VVIVDKRIRRRVVELRDRGANVSLIKDVVLKEFGRRLFSDEVKGVIGGSRARSRVREWPDVYDDAMRVVDKHSSISSISRELAGMEKYAGTTAGAISSALRRHEKRGLLLKRLDKWGDLDDDVMRVVGRHRSLHSVSRELAGMKKYSGRSSNRIYALLRVHEKRSEFEKRLLK
jgi:hypothetical protein